MRRNSLRAGAIGTALLTAMTTTSLADSKD